MATTTTSQSDINPQLVPVRKDNNTIRIEVLTNIIKMFRSRGYIKDSYSTNINKIKKESDTDIYSIQLDSPIISDNANKNFNGNVVMIKLVYQKIVGITKIPVIKEFIDQHPNNHKIFVFEAISDKAKSSLTSIPNTEVFVESFLMIDLISHIDSPFYEVLSEEETKELLDSYLLKKKEIAKILTTDPVVNYFNLKRGQVIRIIRCSEQSGLCVAYRIVAKGN